MEHEKHFPSDPTIYEDKLTFLTDKKVDARLYAYLIQQSFGGPKGVQETRVYKSRLPPLGDIGLAVGIKSRATVRDHLNYLIENDYITDKGEYYIMNTDKEGIYLRLGLDTIRFLNNTVRENIWKMYIYLGQRWKWKQNEFVFSLEDLAKHIGMRLSNNRVRYEALNDGLRLLEISGFIKVQNFRDERGVPRKRLLSFRFAPAPRGG